jgi:hypothetical protein
MVLHSSFLIGELMLSTSVILKSTMLFRTYLYFTTTFLSHSFYFALKLNLIYSMSFNIIPYLSFETFEAKIFSRVLFAYTCYFLIISVYTAILSHILAFTTALSCLLLLSLNDIPSYIFETTSTNFVLIPNFSFRNSIRNSVYSAISA